MFDVNKPLSSQHQVTLRSHGIFPEWVSNLVCPITKKPLKFQKNNVLSCDDGEHVFRFEDGIAIFLNSQERGAWDSYNFDLDSEPKPIHPYYGRFTDGWKTMLDLGCGDGVISAGSAHKVADIYCVNPGITALHVLNKRKLDNMHPVCVYGEQLPFTNDFFDGILNVFVIEHVANPEPMLLEIRRVLKPDGKLVIATDSAIFYQYLRPLLEWRRLGWRQGWRKWKPNDPTHINMMAPKDLRRWLKKTGFTILEEHFFYYSKKLCKLLGWLPPWQAETLLTTMFVFVARKNNK